MAFGLISPVKSLSITHLRACQNHTLPTHSFSEGKKEVQKGIDELDRGETVEFTAADIQRLGRERLASAERR
jgi:hypothetical protein